MGSKELVEGMAENTVEFHWYVAEEAGELGSQAIFLEYARRGVDVRAMLQQDMTGFYNATIEKKKEFGLMMDLDEWRFLFLCSWESILTHASRQTVDGVHKTHYFRGEVALYSGSFSFQENRC